MPFSQVAGYTPASIETIMGDIMVRINEQFGTEYTYEAFVGTNHYKYFYALAQRAQENEIKTSEIFLKLTQYFEVTNERISRPVGTPPGLIEKFTGEGFTASVKPMILADAGKINVCVEAKTTDPDYAAKKLAIGKILKDSVAGGIVTIGDQVQNIVLSNGQAFDFKYVLPDRHTTYLRLTITLSENNQLVVGDPDSVRAKLLANIKERYKLGRNFEPQRYFTISDAPWASQVKLEYSLNAGTTWLTAVYDAEFDDLFEVSLANTTLVEV